MKGCDHSLHKFGIHRRRCLPKDTQRIIRTDPQHLLDFSPHLRCFSQFGIYACKEKVKHHKVRIADELPFAGLNGLIQSIGLQVRNP